jgi:hypothetical protein
MCGKPNPEELEECQFCGARLKPVIASPSDDSQVIKPGEEPVKRKTSELEKVNLSRGAPIRPGEAPTKKNTAELERALPSWLRTLREGKRPAAGETMAEPSAQESPAVPSAAPAPDSSEGLPDWLSDLGKADSEEEEIPDWLAGLRGGKSDESAPAPASEEELSPGPGNADWMARLGSEPQQATPEPPNPLTEQPGYEPSQPAGMDDSSDWLKSLESPSSGAPAAPAFETSQPAGVDDSPDWLKSLQSLPASEQAAPAVATPAGPAGVDDSPDWLKDLQSTSSAAPEPPAALQGGDSLPDWLSGLPGISAQNSPTSNETGEPARAESTPDWLDQLNQNSIPLESAAPATPDTLAAPAPTSSGTESVPDWLSGLGSVPAAPAPATPAPASGGTEPVPDWLSGLGSVPVTPVPASGGTEPVPDWLSGLEPAAQPPASPPAEIVPDWPSNPEEKSAPASGMPVAAFSGEPQSAGNPPAETPSWLSQLQADVNAAQEEQQHKDDFEVVPAAPTSQKETGPLPEWLSGIQPTTPISSSTLALIGDNDNPPGEQGDAAFSMETPDWLSKLNPEQAAEKPVAAEGQADSEILEAAELPSWVQALRPVESVVESKSAAMVESQVAEGSGPLAGLTGVLPSGPGLGLLRKPPAYSTKLQVSDGQQHYASTLERMIAGETNPRTPKPARLSSNQLLRWLITVLLLLAVGLPFVISTNANGVGIAPASLLGSSDHGAASKVVDALPTNVPVLVAFDYDAALSGELEAVAAPVMDRLLSKGVRLALISTSPTGPILAEHFLQTTPLVKDYQYQSGNQYINLGYLAGGPAGILYFADSPTQAVTVGMDGQPAWGAGPLQGIRKLSDFAAVIILTNNADTGRDWIEQAGPHLGSTPMLMLISAQAEPMIRPYFDSGQLKGLVSGLSDAKIYEQSNQSLGPTHQFGLDNQYWDSFSVGMLVAELLIFVGVVIGVLVDWRNRHKESGEEA